MSEFPISKHPPVDGLTVNIVHQGEVLTLDYNGAMTEHKSSLWWGTAVGYRAMQMAAMALSEQTLWARDNLYVVSGHPGPGVIDSLNYVTGCRDRNQCTIMQNPGCTGQCNSEMKFEWWVCDQARTAHVLLREDFVPQAFYDLTDRLFADVVSDEDKRLFEIFKVNLSTKIWNAPLQDSFSVIYEAPLTPGELPANHAWSLQSA